MADGIPDGITREDVIEAIAGFDAGVSHEFAPSTGYDLVFTGKTYPPKAILGLGARRVAGRILTPYDFKGGEGSRCFRILRDLRFAIRPKSADPDPANSSRTQESATAELAHRYALWQDLKGRDAALSPSILRELGVYGGAQGIWVDKQRTHSLTEDGHGVTVSVLHTGNSYADDLSGDGVLYHYPSTDRPAGRDRSEIEATKAAGILGLPIFVISYPSPSSTSAPC